MKAASLACLATSALLVGLAPKPADGRGEVSVNPTLVVLSDKTTSALVSLSNDGQESMRFELSAFAWNQSPDGQMLLGPTEDLVFFPQLLSLEPGESRNVRVATLAAPAPVERSYRLFIEQLPASQADRRGGRVQVLTRIGIPIFLEPVGILHQSELQDLAVEDGAFSFSIANTGTVHMTPGSLKMRGLNAGGSVAFERSVETWYILAGGSRRFRVPLGDLPPGAADSLLIELEGKDTRLEAQFPRAAALQRAGRDVR